MKINPFEATCLFSWFLLVVTALISLGVPKVERLDYSFLKFYLKYYVKKFWMTHSTYLSTYDFNDVIYIIIKIWINYPILMDYYIYWISFVILIALIVFSCAILFFAQFKMKDKISGMYGTFSRFHFIPLLCASAIFIIGESQASEDYDYDSDAPYILNFIFSIIGISVLILVHKKTEISSFKLGHYVIKQLTYGWLFVIFVYNFFFSIYLYGEKKQTDDDDFRKNCYISFVIVMGIFNLGIAFLLTNVIICVANCLIYLGMTIWFFQIPDVEVNDKNYTKPNGDAEGIIGIVMMVLSLAVAGFMIFKYKSQILV